jgi:hypothetical protein
MPSALPRSHNHFPTKADRSGSGRVARLKAKTLYNNMVGVANTNGPVKKGDDSYFYGPLYINPVSKCLVHAADYATFLSVTKGKYYCTPDLSNSVFLTNESVQGAALTYDQSGANVTDLSLNSGTFNKVSYPLPSALDASGHQSSGWDGMVSDPSYQLFGNFCAPVPFMQPDPAYASIDICGNLLISKPELPNFVFPGPLKFT